MAQPMAKAAAGADLYVVLGVDRAAEPEVIDAAYRALARKYHPDVNHAPDAAERTRALNAAYRTLQDPIARGRYDVELSLRPPSPGSMRAPTRSDSDGSLDLFGAALADVWRRARTSANLRRGPVGDTAGSAGRGSRRWALPALAFGGGLAVGVAGASGLAGRSSRALGSYWSAAAAGRAGVLETRQPHDALAAAGFAAVLGNPIFGAVATQLIAALEGATARLRSAGVIPPEAEAYHFLQLDDWREERDVRFAQREAVQNRNPEAWSTATERELAWRVSALHGKAEVAAAQVAALAAQR